MKKLTMGIVLGSMFFMAATLFAAPTVFPTGTTIYKPEKCWSGYTVLSVVSGIHWKEIEGDESPLPIVPLPLIDMNGNIVHEWTSKNEDLVIVGGPAKVFPGGRLFAQYKYKDKPGFFTDIAFQMGFDGSIEWQWQKNEQTTFKAMLDARLEDQVHTLTSSLMGDKKNEVASDGKQSKAGQTKVIWTANQHHDMQRWPSPTGYYAPGLDPDVKKGRIMINGGTKKNVGITELDPDGTVLWEWKFFDHREEFKEKGIRPAANTSSWLGPNKWYDAGDERFHPENIIMDDASGRTIYIISKKTGKIAWHLGPDYTETPHLKYLGLDLPGGAGVQVGGMLHHAHMIPKGLPGEGNILVFNNGNPYSMIYEIDPVTLELVWEYSGETIGYGVSHGLAHMFFNPDMGSAQRLPNGNTLITESNNGRIFEVTPELETVWEYIYPVNYLGPMPMWWSGKTKNFKRHNAIYRAYRVPYDWVPQLKKPKELPVIPPDNADFRMMSEEIPTPYK